MMLASVPMSATSRVVPVMRAAPWATLWMRSQMPARVALEGLRAMRSICGEVGHDVGGDAALGDDVVDAGVGGDVLAHELDAVAHEHDGVERGAAAVGRDGGVGGDAVEGELGGDDGERAAVVDAVAVAGVPVQDDVDVVEEAGADHVDLAGAAFFGGRAVVAEGAGDVVCGHVLLDRDGGESGAGAEEVVAAAVAGRVGDDGVAGGFGLLREAGEGVELAEDGDDGRAGAVAGDEGGGLIGDAGS